jgi:hypothetical protein
MSPRRNWDSPTPSLASECAPPPGTKGWRVGYSDFYNLMGFTSKKMPNNFL